MTNVAPREHSVAELLEAWREIEALAVALNSSSTLGPNERRLVEHWFNLFEEEIDLLQRVRNAVVHGSALTTGDIADSVEVANRMLHLLKAKLQRAPRAV